MSNPTTTPTTTASTTTATTTTAATGTVDTTAPSSFDPRAEVASHVYHRTETGVREVRGPAAHNLTRVRPGFYENLAYGRRSYNLQDLPDYHVQGPTPPNTPRGPPPPSPYQPGYQPPFVYDPTPYYSKKAKKSRKARAFPNHRSLSFHPLKCRLRGQPTRSLRSQLLLTGRKSSTNGAGSLLPPGPSRSPLIRRGGRSPHLLRLWRPELNLRLLQLPRPQHRLHRLRPPINLRWPGLRLLLRLRPQRRLLPLRSPINLRWPGLRLLLRLRPQRLHHLLSLRRRWLRPRQQVTQVIYNYYRR